MMTIEDYLKLSKKRLAEMLVERDRLDKQAFEKFKEVIGENLSPSVKSNPNPCSENNNL